MCMRACEYCESDQGFFWECVGACLCLICDRESVPVFCVCVCETKHL